VTTNLDVSVVTPGHRGGGRGRFYAGQSGEERDAARRERLLVAIHEIVGTRGYSGLTVERLCSAASVSTRNFYELYAGKEEAFADLYDVLLNQAGARAVTSLEETRGLPIHDRIPAALLAFLSPMLADSRTARIAFVEVVGLSARIEETRLANREKLIGLIEASASSAVETGEISSRDFRFASIALISATTALVFDWMSRDRRPPHEWLELKLTQLAVHLLTS
jgi:AcrR family transcriptional regulator